MVFTLPANRQKEWCEHVRVVEMDMHANKSLKKHGRWIQGVDLSPVMSIQIASTPTFTVTIVLVGANERVPRLSLRSCSQSS